MTKTSRSLTMAEKKALFPNIQGNVDEANRFMVTLPLVQQHAVVNNLMAVLAAPKDSAAMARLVQLLNDIGDENFRTVILMRTAFR